MLNLYVMNIGTNYKRRNNGNKYDYPKFIYLSKIIWWDKNIIQQVIYLFCVKLYVFLMITSDKKADSFISFKWNSG